MTVQTERIEGHQARLTVPLEPAQFDGAMRQAARKISRRINVPGFRKGRAPFKLVMQAVGPQAVTEEALDILADKLYKSAVKESGIMPSGPGSIEDLQQNPMALVFTVPLVPEADLGDFRSIRHELDFVPVTETMVDRTLRMWQLESVEVLAAEREVAALGNRVTLAAYGEFLDGEEPDDEADEADDGFDSADDALNLAEAATAEATSDFSPSAPKKGDTFLNDDNFKLILEPDAEPLWRDVIETLIGAEQGSDIEVEMTIGDDVPDIDEGMIGRRVSFNATLKEIEEITYPALDDAFVRKTYRRLGAEEMDLAGLRVFAREYLTKAVLQTAEEELADKILKEIIAGAQVAYPDRILEQDIDEKVAGFGATLKQRGISLKDYYRYTNSTEEDLREEYHSEALEGLRRNIVLGELNDVLNIEVSDEELKTELELTALRSGNTDFMEAIGALNMPDLLRNRIALLHIKAQLVALAQGKDPAAASEALRAKRLKSLQDDKEVEARKLRYLEEDKALTAAEQAAEAPETRAV